MGRSYFIKVQTTLSRCRAHARRLSSKRSIFEVSGVRRDANGKKGGRGKRFFFFTDCHGHTLHKMSERTMTRRGNGASPREQKQQNAVRVSSWKGIDKGGQDERKNRYESKCRIRDCL
jgi:hypothetical protein